MGHGIRTGAWIAVICMAVLLHAPPALAYNFYQPTWIENYNTSDECPGAGCNNVFTDPGMDVVCPETDPNSGAPNIMSGLIRRVVPCIKETILYAVGHPAGASGINDPGGIMVVLSTYMRSILGAAFTLAIAFWGVSMTLGHRTAPMRDMFILMLKLGGVWLFANNLGGMFGSLLDGMDQIMGLITQYVFVSPGMDCPNSVSDSGTTLAVWDALDCAVNNLTGGIFIDSSAVSNPNNPAAQFMLTSGVLGFFSACLFSNNPAGFLVALMGFFLIIQILYAIARSVYIYVTSYVAVALMATFSPLFVPLILFNVSRAYFDKWARIFMMFMLQGLFLTVYLVICLAGFDVIVYGSQPYSLAAAIAGSDYTGETGSGTPNDFFSKYTGLGGWLNTSGAYAQKDLWGKAVTVDPAAIAKKFPNMDSKNLGAEGTVTQQLGLASTDYQKNIFEALGIGVKANGAPDTSNLLYSVNSIPVNGVDWDALAKAAGFTGATATSDYLVNLCIAMLMACLTAYIFKIMLDYVPYIGAGVAEMGINIPYFGVNSNRGNMAPPGEKFINGLQENMGKRFQKAKS